MKCKRILAALLAGAALVTMAFSLTACGKPASSPSASSTPKDYTQILHDARPEEDNEYEMIFSKGDDGKFTAQYGYSESYEAGQLNDEIENMLWPLLGLEDDMVEDFAASVSGMMVQSYAIAIVKPAEGKTETVQAGLQAFIDQQKAAQEHYLEDQYAIAKNAKLGVMPGGEVVMVMCEDSDTVYANIEKALK